MPKDPVSPKEVLQRLELEAAIQEAAIQDIVIEEYEKKLLQMHTNIKKYKKIL